VKRWIISLFTFLSGFFYILEFVLPSHTHMGKALQEAKPHVGEAIMVIAAFAVGLGVIGVCRHHLRKLFLRQKGWHNSLALLLSMFGMALFKIWEKYDPPELATRLHDLLFLDLYNQLTITVFSLLAFYVASAAYRAFRVRSVDAGLMMITALVVMLGQIPLGDRLAEWLRLPWTLTEARLWIMSVINMAGQRVILLGAYVGSLAFGIRVLLGLNRDTILEKDG